LNDELMLCVVHARLKGVDVIVVDERNRRGGDYRACIDAFVRDPMNHYTGLCDRASLPRIEGSRNRVGAGELPRLGRVQIHDWERRAHCCAENSHPPCEHYERRLERGHSGNQSLVTSVAFGARLAVMLDVVPWHTRLFSSIDNSRISAVGYHRDYLRIERTALTGVKDCLTVCAAP